MIAGRIPGRTDNEIKNYWNTHLSKKLISQGIDPRTHKPLSSTTTTTTTPPSNHSSKKYHPTIPNGNHQTPSTHNQPIQDQAVPNPDHPVVDANQEFDPYLEQNQRLHHQAAGNIVGANNAYDNLDMAAAAATATDDVSAMGLIKSNIDHVLAANNEDYDDINYCSDDIFSSFLNSLINEDAFASQHHLQSVPPNGNHDIALPSDDHDPLISITTASAPPDYGIGVAWESPLMPATFNQNDPSTKRVDDDHNK